MSKYSKKITGAILLVILLIPSASFAVTVPWDRPTAGQINPLYVLDQVKANFFTATSTSQASTFPFASTTHLSVATNLWLTALATPAGTVLAVDPSGKVIATTTSAGGVTSVTGVYPIISSGGATPAISTAFGTTTANTFSALNIFVNSTSTLFTCTTCWAGTLNLTNALTVPNGGTGATTLTGILQGNGTSAFTAIADSSTVGQTLRVTGASTYAWGALNLASSNAVTGVLPIANGGTNANTFGTSNGIVAYDGTRQVNFSGFTLVSGLLTAPNITSTNSTTTGKLYIPNSSSQTPTEAGQLALDTTNNQLKVGDGSATAVFDQRRNISFGVLATTTSIQGTTTVTVPMDFAMTFNNLQCKTNVGTMLVQISYGQPATNLTTVSASSTMGRFTFTGNNTPPAATTTTIAMGTPASSPTSLGCTLSGTVTGT